MIGNEEITGTLENWSFDGIRLYGNLYNDVYKRWAEGERIHTSTVLTGSKTFPQPKFEEGEVIQTRNSRYKLGKKREV